MHRYLLPMLAITVFAPQAHAQRQAQRDAFTWSQKIPEGRWIRVRNLNGEIHVESTSGDKVEVTATKRYRRSDPETVRFEVQKVGPNQQDVLICALWTDRSSCDQHGYESHNVRNNDVKVEFRVLVPKGVKVGVATVNGAVDVDGVTSEVDASTVNGGVDVNSTGGPVNASTVNGDVNARMGKFTLDNDVNFSTVNGSVIADFVGELDADVELSTVNGRFYTDYQVTVSGRLDPRHLRAKIGKGGPRVRLTTVNGSVELRRRG